MDDFCRLNSIKHYRQMEMCVFFCMMGGMILYLITSKIFLFLRSNFSSPQKLAQLKEVRDPYWTLLMTSKTGGFDFLEHDNFIMETLSLMFANNLWTIFATTEIFSQIFSNYKHAFVT